MATAATWNFIFTISPCAQWGELILISKYSALNSRRSSISTQMGPGDTITNSQWQVHDGTVIVTFATLILQLCSSSAAQIVPWNQADRYLYDLCVQFHFYCHCGPLKDYLKHWCSHSARHDSAMPVAFLWLPRCRWGNVASTFGRQACPSPGAYKYTKRLTFN